MIIKFYYSSLNNKFYKDKKSAQKAEDEYVDEYFKELDRQAAIKKRKLRSLIK